MKKKAIYAIVCLIVLSFASIVAYQEVAILKGRRELVKELKRQGLQYYPDREIGEVLEEFVYYYIKSNTEIEGNEYFPPVLVLCKTTDCFTQSSLSNTDVSIIRSWSFKEKDDKSSIKALYDALDAIRSDYPGIYGVRIIFLSFYGQIDHEQSWPFKPLIPIDDENF